MKKINLISILLIFLLVLSLNVFSVNDGEVYITPENPIVGDTLTCGVQGSSNTHDYYWFVNTKEVKSSSGVTSTLSTSSYKDGDVITCEVFIPNWDVYVGSASVVLEEAYNDVPVTMDFYSNVTEGDVPLNVKLTCEATGNNPFEYTIKTGDGYSKTFLSNENSVSLEYTYNNPGDYNAECIVKDKDGDVGVKNLIIKAKQPYNDLPIIVDLNVNPKSGEAPLTINYSCNANGNEPITYYIDFGDGTTTNNNIGSHTYNNPGDYIVTCNVVDNDGDFGSDWESVNVIQGYNDIPASVSVNMNYNYVEYNRVDITATCNIDGNAPYTYFVYFDGMQVDSGTTMNNILTYSFNNRIIGVHEFKCLVFDYDNDYAEDEMRIEIPEQDIDFTNMNFNVYPLEGDAPLTVDYSCSTTGGNYPITYAINFGDGITSNNNIGSHTYNNPGVYTLTCTATDKDGDTISENRIVTVNQPYNDIPVSVDLNVIPVNNFPYAPADMIIQCSYTGNAPYRVTLEYSVGSRTIYTNDTQQAITVTYNNPGMYDVVCVVEDKDGDISSKSYSFTLYDKNATWNIEANPLEGETPLLVFFKANIEEFGNVTVHWDFNDGHYITGNEVKHLFVKPGSYEVKAYFYDENNFYHEKTITINVYEKTPTKTKIDYDKFRIKHLVAYKGYNSILVSVTAENFVGEDLEDIKVAVFFPNSGYEFEQTISNINNKDQGTVTFEVPLIYDEDLIIVKAYNDEVSDAKKTLLI